MDSIILGRTGLDVSAIVLGTEHLERSTDNIGEILRICVERVDIIPKMKQAAELFASRSA